MKKVLCAVIAVVLVFTAVYFAVPQLRVRMFVACYGDTLEHGFETQSGLPANIGIKYSNVWSGEHDMHELILFEYGETSYGCYYSPDDVPLPFQNMDVELLHDGHYYWEWNESREETNYGKTSKIKDKWYYFEVELNKRKTDNHKYFKDIIENQGFEVSRDVMYYPELLSSCSNPSDVLLNIQNDCIEYSYEEIIYANSGFEFQEITVSYNVQSSGDVVSAESFVDGSIETGMDAVCCEYKGKQYAFIYDEREDLNKTVVNVYYPLSDNVTAYYAMKLNNITKINNEIIEKVCSEVESVAL